MIKEYSMKQENKEIFAGTVAFIVFLAFFSYVFVSDAEKKKYVSSKNYTVTAIFRDMEGISVGSPVRLAGIDIGSVTSMTLTNNFSSSVDITILKGILLPSDSAISVQSDGLFGDKFLEIMPGAEEDMLPFVGGAFSYSQDSMRLGDILEKVVNYAKKKIKECNICLEEASGGKEI